MQSLALRYLFATLACVVMTLLATPLALHMDLANIIMLFLLEVMAVALYLGRAPAVWAAFLSVASFDFFFVPPKFTFTVDDPQYLLTFAVMLAVALVIGQLTAKLSRQAQSAAMRERCEHALGEMARNLADAADVPSLVRIADRCLRNAFGAEAELLLRDANGQFVPAGPAPSSRLHVSPIMASLAYDNTPCIDVNVPYPTSYLPLRTASGQRGVLVVISPTQSAIPITDRKEFLQTAASLVVLALERLQSVGVAARIPQSCGR